MPSEDGVLINEDLNLRSVIYIIDDIYTCI